MHTFGRVGDANIEDLPKMEVVILWGTNLVSTGVHAMPFVNQARENGAKIIAIDPRVTRTTAFADWHIQPRPGTDAALALGVAAKRAGRTLAVEHCDLFRRPLTYAELARYDAVVIDPPRAGAKEQAAELARSAVRRVAYVSCNPSTFARDAKTLLEGGYRLDYIDPVGQFRWSTHVELAASFVR